MRKMSGNGSVPALNNVGPFPRFAGSAGELRVIDIDLA